MFILTDELRIQTTQFDASVIGRELPVDLGRTKVAIVFPRRSLIRQTLAVVDSTRQTLPPKYAQLAFGNVQPASVLRRVMNLQTLRQSPGFARSERFIKRCGRMGVQVVHDQYDPLRSLVFFVQEVSQRKAQSTRVRRSVIRTCR